ncbi:MAG: tRNA preQ1(34) S-adenosylmethionine ribosyltransferase-isomerase QueA [Coriobacteriales bacterium]|nr:tRNA preQ1(34) S-adenosylmethionine ribosyltransferase-isomerase QueA [Coriobacteriales bacterium]
MEQRVASYAQAGLSTSDFDYQLPSELIAQSPAFPRDSCRLLVLDKRSGAVTHEVFRDIIDHIKPGDLLVANETRVMPARLNGFKTGTGGAVEILLLKERGRGLWECLVKPGRRLRPGAQVEFKITTGPLAHSDQVVLRAQIKEMAGTHGERLVAFEPVGMSLDDALHAAGKVPLPPYITQYTGDPEMYQTVFARKEHSAAAPTAGLHFTPQLIQALKDKGARFETVELEVGVDTFRTVTEEDPTKHHIHTERYHVPQRVVDAIHETHAAGGRVIAVGTTSVRSLESAWDEELGDIRARESADTSLFILPGYTFHVVDALITNFHVPRSTLMMLVSAFAGREHIMDAYQQAIERRYRMLSFGDAMLIE